jgi:uncharacterized glyoxalase superfamily protein PhnB/ketosteroid isomerase-like protein
MDEPPPSAAIPAVGMQAADTDKERDMKQEDKQGDAQAGIRQTLDDWIAAVDRHDLAALAACYAADVVAYDAIKALRFQGRDPYLAHWEQCLQMCPNSVHFTLRDLDVQAADGLGYAHALLACTADGEAGNAWSRMTTGFRRESGRWLIVHEHFSFPFDPKSGKALMGLSPDAEAGPAPIPSDMHSVTPHLVCRDATSALDFYQRAFGASGAVRLDGPDGKLMHGCLWIGNSAVMLMEESPACQSGSPVTLGGTPVTLHLYVPDADAAFERAVRAGATSVMAPADMFWGDRYGVVQDPYGHRWSIATHVRDVSPEDMRAAMAQFASA